MNQVVTLHDASTLDHPEWFSGNFAKWYRFLLPRLARRVRKVITVSEFSRRELARLCRIPEEKIVAIHNGISPRFVPASEEARAALRRKHGLEKPFVLYLGSLEPRKNVAALLAAWKIVAPREHELVLAGAASRIFRERGFAELPAGTRLLGRVDDPELPTLLSAADWFAFPALYEGFGFPPLEAMACGTPVLCSNATCLPEVCGAPFDPAAAEPRGAALYFDPHRIDELTGQLRRALAMDDATRSRLMEQGRKQAALYTWDHCAAQTLAVLEELNGNASEKRSCDRDESQNARSAGSLRSPTKGSPDNYGPRMKSFENVALAHHWMVSMRGGEKVLEQIGGMFPGAPIYTLVANPSRLSAALQSHPIRTSLLQRLPGAARHYKKMLPFFPEAVGALRVSPPVDLIVSSDASVIKGLAYPEGTPHVCYCHSPPRYLWDMQEDYRQSAEVGGRAGRFVFNRVAPRVREFDRRAAERVTHFIANSEFVRERIRISYGRESVIIYPPVALESFTMATTEPEDFDLVVSQLVPYKRIDVAVAAFTRLGRRLVIIGEGSEREKLEAMAGANHQLSRLAAGRRPAGPPAPLSRADLPGRGGISASRRWRRWLPAAPSSPIAPAVCARR